MLNIYILKAISPKNHKFTLLLFACIMYRIIVIQHMILIITFKDNKIDQFITFCEPKVVCTIMYNSLKILTIHDQGKTKIEITDKLQNEPVDKETCYMHN